MEWNHSSWAPSRRAAESLRRIAHAVYPHPSHPSFPRLAVALNCVAAVDNDRRDGTRRFTRHKVVDYVY